MSKQRITVKSACLFINVMVGIFLNRYGYADTYYKYVDKNGTVCFTDDLQSVSYEYKKKVIIMSNKKETSDKESKESQAREDNEGSPITKEKQNLSYKERIKRALRTIGGSNFSKPAVFITIFLCLFVAAGKIASTLGHKQISSGLRIVLTACILVYLFHAYAKGVVNTFSLLKKDATDVTKQAEERNKKAEDLSKDPLEPGLERAE